MMRDLLTDIGICLVQAAVVTTIILGISVFVL